MQVLFLSIALCGLAEGVFAQAARSAGELEQSRTKLNPAIEGIIATSRAFPVEFFADVVYRLRSAGQITGTPGERILTDVFERSASAARPYYLTYPRDDKMLDLVFLAGASNLRLDELSIQVRAIREMAKLNPERASDWLDRVAPPKPGDAQCNDLAVPDADALYEYILEASETIQDAPDSARGFYSILTRHISALSTPLQMVSAARLLRNSKLSSRALSETISIYSARLAEVQGGSLSFAIAIGQGELLKEIEGLASRQIETGDTSTALLGALRKFLVYHLRLPACAVNSNAPAEGPQSRDAVVNRFNEASRRYAPDLVPPIAAEDTRPEEGKPYTGQRRPEARLEQALGPCLMNLSKSAATPKDQRPVDWPERFERCLGEIEEWKPEHLECDECLLAAKTKTLLTLIQIGADSADVERVVRSYLRLLEHGELQRKRPADWLVCLKALVNATRKVDRADEAALANRRSPLFRPNARPSVVLALLKASPDPVISLYAELEAVAPQSYSLWWNGMKF